MYGTRDLAVRASFCGPVTPEPSPVCVNADEPVGDAMNRRPGINGPIQFYPPLTLADMSTGVMSPAPDCTDCDPIAPGTIDCGTIPTSVCTPLPAIQPTSSLACLCVPEQLTWSNPQLVEDAMGLMSAAQARANEEKRLAAIRAQSTVYTFTEPLGHSRGTLQAIYQILALLDCGRETSLGDSWNILIPKASSYASMADAANAANINLDNLLERVVDRLNARVIEYIDHDPDSPNPAPMCVGPVGVAGALPNFYQTPSLYLFQRETFIEAEFGVAEWGVDATDRELVKKGCRQMIRRWWSIPPTKVGCGKSIVVDFTKVCVSGAGPENVAVAC
jgi:hypothetical protein